MFVVFQKTNTPLYRNLRTNCSVLLDTEQNVPYNLSKLFYTAFLMAINYQHYSTKRRRRFIMKKFIAILLTTLSIVATLFTLLGCSSSSDGYTKKQWIEKSAPLIYKRYYTDDDGKLTFDKNSEFEIKIKKLSKHSKYDDSYIFVSEEQKYYKVKTKNYKVSFIKYYQDGDIGIFNQVYSISVVDCKHCNNFLRFGENKKYCKDCVKSFKIGTERFDSVFAECRYYLDEVK